MNKHVESSDYNQRFLALDTLRVVAVSLVFLFHFGYLPIGWVGVDIFFVISGFLIAYILTCRPSCHDQTMHGRKQTALNFILRRLWRIYPPMILVASIAFFLEIAFFPLIEFGDRFALFLSSALGIPNLVLKWLSADYFSPITSQFMILHYWSLGVEIQFYAAIALIFFIFGRENLIFLVPLLGFVSLLVWIFNEGYWTYSLIPRFWEFVVGWITFLACMDRLNKRCYIIIIGTLLLAFSAAQDLHEKLPIVVSVIASSIIIFMGANLKINFLGKPLRHLAGFSFSIYLCHWPFSVLARHFFPHYSSELMILSIITAILLRMFFERHFESGKNLSFSFLKKEKKKSSLVILTVVLFFSVLLIERNRAENTIVTVAEYFGINTTGALILGSENRLQDWPNEFECKLSNAEKLSIKDCVDRGFDTGQNLFVVGDSHALQLINAVEFTAESNELIWGYLHSQDVTEILNTGELSPGLREIVHYAGEGDVVFFTMYRGKLRANEGRLVSEDAVDTNSKKVSRKISNLERGLTAFASGLNDRKAVLVLVDDGPILSRNTNASSCEFFLKMGRDLCAFDSSLSKMDRRPLTDVFIGVSMQNPNVYYGDYHDLICEDSICSHRSKDGDLLMVDFNHLSWFAGHRLHQFIEGGLLNWTYKDLAE